MRYKLNLKSPYEVTFFPPTHLQGSSKACKYFLLDFCTILKECILMEGLKFAKKEASKSLIFSFQVHSSIDLRQARVERRRLNTTPGILDTQPRTKAFATSRQIRSTGAEKNQPTSSLVSNNNHHETYLPS